MKSNQMHIQQIEFEENFLIVHANESRRKYALQEISLKLLNAKPKEREKFQISPSGLGIHWPLIDEDLSFTNL